MSIIGIVKTYLDITTHILQTRVTFKIEAQEFHQTIQVSLHSKTFIIQLCKNYANLKHCTMGTPFTRKRQNCYVRVKEGCA